eukprot:164752-Rhodomonas_salina.1
MVTDAKVPASAASHVQVAATTSLTCSRSEAPFLAPHSARIPQHPPTRTRTLSRGCSSHSLLVS